MKVAVVGGAGYVGLVTGLGLAAIGHEVVSVDVDERRIENLRAGNPGIYEEGLDNLTKECVAAGRIRFTTSLQEAARHGDIIFIIVGTPSRLDDQADLSQVTRVAEELGEHIDGYKIVVVKSTVPVGTEELIRSILSRRKKEGEDFDIVANPEFLREGKGLLDFFDPDRIVVGVSSERAKQSIRALYEPIIRRRVSWPGIAHRPGTNSAVPLVETDLASAQMIKYAANAFLATRISFINEIAGLCERVGADVREVARGLGHDPRIGFDYLEAGLGFGGPCLEKDLRALIKIAEETQYAPVLLQAVLERNEDQVREVVRKIKHVTGYLLHKRIVAIFGLAFKRGTNDIRNSLALRLIQQLERESAIVQAHDPLANQEARAVWSHGAYFDDPYEAVTAADVLVIATDWPAFRELNYASIRSRMAQACIVDGRNLLDAQVMRSLGFRYEGVGIR